MVQTFKNTASLLSFNDAAEIHFLAQQKTENGPREIAIREEDGAFFFTIATGDADAPDFIEEECASLHQAYAHLVRNLNAPL